DVDGKPTRVPHKWTFYFLMSVGFWNFVGAGMFGFFINLPIVSYYEVGTQVTPTHGHAALMGVFGMLALALMVFVLRQTSSDERWPGIEKYVKVGFWGTNIGLAMMLLMSLFPSGVLQLWDVVQHRLHEHAALARDRVAAPAGRPGLHHLRRDSAGDRLDQGLARRACGGAGGALSKYRARKTRVDEGRRGFLFRAFRAGASPASGLLRMPWQEPARGRCSSRRSPRARPPSRRSRAPFPGTC